MRRKNAVPAGGADRGNKKKSFDIYRCVNMWKNLFLKLIGIGLKVTYFGMLHKLLHHDDD
jgi:hypothetical protein